MREVISVNYLLRKNHSGQKIDVFIDECLYLKGGLYNRISEKCMNDLQLKLYESYHMISNPAATQDIDQGTQNIEQLQQDSNFLREHIQLLIDNNIPNELKILMLIYLTKNIQRIVQKSKEQRFQECFHEYLDLFSKEIDFIVKKETVNLMKSTLKYQKMAGYKNSLRKSFSNYIVEFSAKELEGQQFSYIIFYGQSLILQDCLIENSELVKKIMPSLICIASKLMKKVTNISVQQIYLLQYNLQLMKQMLILLKSCLKEIKAKHIELMRILFMEELEDLIKNILEYKHQDNVFGLELFTLVQQQPKITKNINIIKQKSINIINYIFNILVANIKSQSLMQNNPMYLSLSNKIQTFINELSQVFSKVPCFQLTSELYLLDVAYEIFNILSNVIQHTYFYSIFSKNKSQLILNVIFPCISYNPRDLQAFENDQFEYIQHILQVIQPEDQEQKNENEPIEDYQSFRTFSAKFLRLLCKFQDGSLNEILHIIIESYNSNNFQVAPKALLLFIICIIFPQIKLRKIQYLKIYEIVKIQFQDSKIPLVTQPNAQSIQYTFKLMLIYKYINKVTRDETFLQKMMNKIIEMISNQNTWNVHQYFMIFVLDSITLSESNSVELSTKVISVYNWALDNSPWLVQYVLDSYVRFIKRYSSLNQNNIELVLQALDKLIHEFMREIELSHPNLVLINKIMNFFSEVVMNSKISAENLPKLEEYLLFISQGLKRQMRSKNIKVVEEIIESVFLISEILIENFKSITQNQIKMFQMVELWFYKDERKAFHDSFKLVETILKYGNVEIFQHQELISKIALMCLQTLSKTQNLSYPKELQICKSVILLQSLIYRYLSIINSTFCTTVIKSILQILSSYHPSGTYLHPNLLSLMSLSFCHAIQVYSEEEKSFMLDNFTENEHFFEESRYETKVHLIGLTKLLQNVEIRFIRENLEIIFKSIIVLIQFLKEDENSQNVSKKKAVELGQYKKMVNQIKNGINQLDIITIFKEKYQILNASHGQVLARAISKLKDKQKERLSYILKTQKIKNEYRVIYKIKRN